MGLSLLKEQSLNPKAHLVIDPRLVKEAQVHYTKATNLDPEFIRAWVERGVASAMLENNEMAEQELVQAMSLAGGFSPTNVLGLYYLYFRQHKHEDAIDVLKHATDSHWGFLHGLGYLGEAYAHEGQHHDALQVFTAYTKRVPKSPWAKLNRAAAMAHLGKHDQAIKETRAVAKQFPKSLNASVQLASRLIDGKKLNGAREVIEKALARHGRHPLLLTRLSYVALAEDKVPQAMELARKAVAAVGDGRGEHVAGYAHLNLVHALVLSGKEKEARMLLGKAMHLGVDADAIHRLRRDHRMVKFLRGVDLEHRH
jgi:tetratricopeptide (TPR) repeat protein